MHHANLYVISSGTFWQVTAADVEFLRKHTSGYICVGMEGPTLDRLQLPLMVSSAENDEAMYTAFTVSLSRYTVSSNYYCAGPSCFRGKYHGSIHVSCAEPSD